uniref:DUF1479 domain-containing protein n=1 Tax=Pyricularia oryzae (strain 70-15 / ATCC MYA-4617 / FGSC 8958) TaxID=242507 RepID=Q2KEC8_PYRO7|nr:hypothetical protein MGCH7_ch7g1108 [Pyricularia oryzae 70-15]
MWPLSSRPSDSAVVGDVKVALPPPLGALDLRDRRFQIGSVRSASYPSSNPGELSSGSQTSKLALHVNKTGVACKDNGEGSSRGPTPSPSIGDLQLSSKNSLRNLQSQSSAQSTSAPTSTLATTKPQERPKSRKEDRRLNKLRRRARTMEPPVLSFYGAQPVPLQSRFATIKRRLIAGREKEVAASWARLIVALNAEMAAIRETSSSLELMGAIDYADIEDPARIAEFSKLLKRFGVGVVRGVVPPRDAEAWVEETRRYLETKHDIKPPPPQDPTCFDFFWTPAQIRARAHPHVLRAMKFAMGLWDSTEEDRMATRFPITYADRIRIHVNSNAAPAPLAQGEQSPEMTAAAATASVPAPTPAPAPAPAPVATAPESFEQAAPSAPASSLPSPTTAAAAADTAAAENSGTIIAQVDGGSLERWEPDGYGRSGTYDSIFRGDWEDYDPWDAAGRISATPDLYNGAGACSIFRMFQGLVALTQVQPGMIRLLPSPKLVTAYFLLRPFFSPKKPAPEGAERQGPEWEAFLHPDNWELDEEQNTIIHGAVPGHAQRVTELWHPHLDLKRTLVTPPDLQAGDYIIWHCETAYTITSSSPPTPVPKAANTDGPRHERFMVYAPACPLTQTNALYMARQRKNFLRGHPGPDFDSTGTGLGTEAPHVGRLGEKEIREVGGEEGLRAMGLAPWSAGIGGGQSDDGSSTEEGAGKADKMDVDGERPAEADGSKMDVDEKAPELPLSAAEVELVRLANIILFPDKYEFYMATRNSSPDGREREAS